MSYIAKIKQSKRQIAGILMTVPLVLLVLGVILPDLPSSPMLRDSFWAHKIDPDQRYDIVFTGDSRIYRGIDPAVVDSMLGSKSFNYGFSSAGLDSFLLGKAVKLLDPAGKRVLVIGISVNSFTQGSLRNSHLKSLLEWNSRDVWIRKHVYPSLTYFDPYAVSDIYKLSRGERYVERYHVSNGYAASYKIPLDSGSAIPAYADQFRHEMYSEEAQKKCIDYISRLVAQDICVVAVRVPVAEEMRMLEDEFAGKSFEQFRKELEKAGAYCPTIGGSFVSYDGSHLTEVSAREFSRQLAQQIK